MNTLGSPEQGAENGTSKESAELSTELASQNMLNQAQRFIELSALDAATKPDGQTAPGYLEACQNLLQIMAHEDLKAGESMASYFGRIKSELGNIKGADAQSKDVADTLLTYLSFLDEDPQMLEGDIARLTPEPPTTTQPTAEVARDQIEKEALLQEVEELAKGTMTVYTYMNDDTARRWTAAMREGNRKIAGQGEGGGGWGVQSEKYRFDGPVSGVEAQGYVPGFAKGKQDDVQEYVVFMPHQQKIVSKVDRDRQIKKLFGRTDTESYTEDVITGYEQETYKDVTGRGVDEPAVRVEYNFDGNQHWSGDGTRPGRRLMVGFSLPESVADRLQTELQSDPTLIRRMVEKMVLDYGYPEDAWNDDEDWGTTQKTKGKPPYEAAPSNHVIRLLKVQPKLDSNSREVLEERVIAAVPVGVQQQ